MLLPRIGRPAVGQMPSSWIATALLAVLWLVAGPATPDLAAQVHRVGDYAAHGFMIWDNSWYDGHNLPGYSLVFPAVAAAIGVRTMGALAAVASAVLFELLIRPRRAAGAHWWFAVGCCADLLIGRLTYALGVAVGLGALMALVRDRPRAACVLAVACAATSPVAGLFLALAGVATAIAGRRRAGVVMGAAALVVVLGLSTAFPEGGTQPFSTAAFLVTATIAACAALVVGRSRLLRPALLLYLAAAIVCFVVPSPMGGNVIRLGTAFVAPALLLAAPQAHGVRRVALLVVLLGAAAWQWIDPLTQAARSWQDASAAPGYYAPVVGRLERAGGHTLRVEVPFTRGHWETAYLARHVALARGWERQLDRGLNPLFYGRRLDPAAYHRWLRANAVSYVALPDAPMDGAGRQEAALVRRVPAFLQPVWSGAHWRLFRVRDALPLVSARASGAWLGDDAVRVVVRRPGRVLVRVHWTPYWRLARGAGCLAKRGPWTTLRAYRRGTYVLTPRFSLGRLFERLPACAALAARV